MMKQPGTRPRTCHKCHCPLNDPRHAGVQSGVDNCTLDHWSGCPGGKQGGPDGNGRAWSACPSASEVEFTETNILMSSQARGWFQVCLEERYKGK